MSKVIVVVNAEVLVWARRNVYSDGDDLSVIFKKLKINRATLKEWETKGARLTMGQIRALAELYKLPSAMLFRKLPPGYSLVSNSFRTLPNEFQNNDILHLPQKMLLAIRKANKVQSDIGLLRDNVDVKPKNRLKMATINLDADPEIVAQNVRDKLKVDIQDQYTWSKKGAFAMWSEVVERQGHLVLEISMGTSDIRGFALEPKGNQPAVIVINRDDVTHGKIFSLFHEYGHLLLAKGGVASVRDGTLWFDERSRAVEVFCNKFAASILLPKDALTSDPIVALHEGNVWSDDDLDFLSRKFKVSKEAVLIRLVHLGFSSQDEYRRMKKIWNSFQYKKTETKWRKSYPHSAVRENGFTFSGMVINALGTGKIGYSEASEYLGVKASYIKGVEKLVAKHYREVLS